ncbi:hypothetical protein M569_03502 [Genlisea aurea]|uniref:non-specific serine/threonine protein kinase n=1 Tax=Genlisea aurea TaxID=192259 RepID=S8E617_9LAMI|nr:hypothetical protein M569_03502 [Genlisea aurea]
MIRMRAAVLFIFYYCSISLCSEDVDTSSAELQALLEIKSHLVDPLDHLSDWKIPAQVSAASTLLHCNWTGVSCSSYGFVERLDLSSMNLTGLVSERIQDLRYLLYLNLCCNGFSSSLPIFLLANLTSLKIVDVSQNNFVGNFPIGLGGLPGLENINASSNNFEGLLPESLGFSASLESLDFRGNFFEGSIPSSFGILWRLKFLGLSGNNLTGKIPSELGNLSSLETMILGYNQFEGPIPSEFGNLSSLQYLDLSVGTLSGQIPGALGRLKRLTTVYLYHNNFEGRIPPEIGNITSLVYLDLSDNQISRRIPDEIANLRNLKLLNLMCNRLVGPIPVRLHELSKLEVLELWQNSLTGYLPLNLGKNSSLKWLDVSSNSLSGYIPPGLCDSGNLTELILFDNSFTGPIPTTLANCSSLVRVRVQNNSLSGSVPFGLGTLPNLQRLELASNEFGGEIPRDLALSTSLSFIDLSNNHLGSNLPWGIFSIPTLQTFSVSSNDLKGNISDQIQDCPSLSVLDLSHNRFSGNVPQSMSSCKKLVTLNLGSNRFTGEIPPPLAMIPTLSVLDLSNNLLVGNIPENFGYSPSLETLNLSYNKLQGRVPDIFILMNINPEDLAGNAGLCGSVLPPCPQRVVGDEARPRKMHMKHAIVGVLVSICVVLSAGGLIFTGRRIHMKWYLYRSYIADSFRKKNCEWPWRLVAFQRLDFTSSDILACLNESNVIGRGGSGIVYKAEIQRVHATVAVKKLWRSEMGDGLLREVNLLGKVRHRNIVRLLGYLFNNKDDVMVMYEYMPNGSLKSALNRKMLLDWGSRYSVALGVAQGLAYLHHHCHPPIIHRDIKSNNVLLDANFEARIADFGLARAVPNDNEAVSTVAGSYGYIAPEYGYTLKVDEKSDVYSYGVVLLELLTGKMALDPVLGDSMDIVKWVRGKCGGAERGDIVDPEIDGVGHGEEMNLVLKIALACTAKLPRERPSMEQVVNMFLEARTCRKQGLILAHSPLIRNWN